MNAYIDRFRDLSKRTQAVAAAGALLFISTAPVFLQGSVQAAPALEKRTLGSTTARPGQSTDLNWTFDTPDTSATNLTKIEIEFCDTPLTSCSNANGSVADPAGGGSTDNIPLLPSPVTATLTNISDGLNTATRVAGDGGGTNNQIDISLTNPASVDDTNGLEISIPGFTNDSEVNRSYYTRMRLYDGATLIYEGVFAQSTSRTLTVNARVQERLDFCIGATQVDDDSTLVAADCTALGGTSVDIGNIENGTVNVSPVAAVNGGSNENGVAMVRTNAINGVVVDYRALQDNNAGNLKIPGSTCDLVPSPVDACFNSASGTVLAAGTELFGMTVAGVNCMSTTAYSCTTATSNIRRDTAYDGNDANIYLPSDADQVATTAGKYAWVDDGTATRIASSASSTVKVVDDEALILKFAATAGITTPTGAYSVQADFIATTTF